MVENKDGWSEFKLFDPLAPLKAVGKAAVWLFSMHQLSRVSNHKFDHPFDTELYEQQEARMRTYWAGLCPDKVEALHNMNQIASEYQDD